MRDDLENIYVLLFRFLRNGFRLALCNVSWLATRESVVLVPEPIGFEPWPVVFGRGRKGDLGDEVDGMKRNRQRRLQWVPEAFERCKCAHDVHFCFLCATFLN